MRGQVGPGPAARVLDDAPHLLVDEGCSGLGCLALPEGRGVVVAGIADRTELLREAPLRYHPPRDGGGRGDVPLGAVREVSIPEHVPLRLTTGHRHGEVRLDLRPRRRVPLVLGNPHDEPQRTAARDDRGLVHRV